MPKSIGFILILCILSLKAPSAKTCPHNLVEIEQESTGRSVKSKPEWKVSATNKCRCALTSLKLMCPKFLSSIEVKPPVISIDREGHCLVKRGNPLHYGESIKFTYAWDPIQFQILTLNYTCSRGLVG